MLAKSKLSRMLAVILFLGVLIVGPVSAQNAQLEDLQSRTESLREEVDLLKGQLASQMEQEETDSDEWYDKFQFGGYGEIHFNDPRGSNSDKMDIHRFIAYVGYDFNDWISLQSELEMEHAFVKDGNGKVLFEQAYLQFLTHEAANLKVGRILVPMGIVNRIHEPPTFNGVERPLVDKYVIPSTWFGDGAGFFGNLSSNLSYELYMVNGLNGSGITADEGFRGARLPERPGYNEPAVTGRLDYKPLSLISDLRVGASFYTGGLDNGNKGNNPGIDGDINVVSGDFEYTPGDFELRGQIAQADVDGETETEKISGYYVEAGYHVLPDSFRKGKLKNSDAVVFARHEVFDTQDEVPSGTVNDPANDREMVTFGLNYYPTPKVVVKADYQVKENEESNNNSSDILNLGVGWQF